MDEKVAATAKVNADASVIAKARRGVFNVGASGRENLLGEKELVDAIVSGEVSLDDIDEAHMPAMLIPMAPEERKTQLSSFARERAAVQSQIQSLAKDRDEFIADKVEEAGGRSDSLDQQLYEIVVEQAGKSGLDYEKGPAY